MQISIETWMQKDPKQADIKVAIHCWMAEQRFQLGKRHPTTLYAVVSRAQFAIASDSDCITGDTPMIEEMESVLKSLMAMLDDKYPHTLYCMMVLALYRAKRPVTCVDEANGTDKSSNLIYRMLIMKVFGAFW